MERSVTYLTPPKLSSLPAESGQLEFSSRSLVFPRDGAGLLRAWGDPDRPFVLRVEAAGGRWRLTAYGAGPREARTAVRAMFSLDDPLEAFYRLVRAEPVLSGSERRFRGLRLPRDGSVYEALVHAVIGQQLSVVVAGHLERRLIEATASVRTVDGTDVPFVPGPAALRAFGPDGLGRIGLSRAKQRALGEIAERAAALGTPAELCARAAPDAVGALDALYGVGRWTAENALLRGAGRRDMFLAGDLGVRVALAAYRTVPFAADEARARAWADRGYPGWGSYATLYLWRKWIAEGCPKPTAPRRSAGPPRSAGARPRPAAARSRTRRSDRRAGSRT